MKIISDEKLKADVLKKLGKKNIEEIELISSVRGKSNHGDRYFLLKNNKGKYALAVSNGWPIYGKGANPDTGEGETYFLGFSTKSEILTDFKFDEIIAESWQDEIFYFRRATKWFLAKYDDFKNAFFSKACDKIEKTHMGSSVIYKLYNKDHYDVVDMKFQYICENYPVFDDKAKEISYLNKKFLKENPFSVRDISKIIPYLVKLIDGIDVVLEEHITPIKKDNEKLAILCLAIKSGDDNLVQQEIETKAAVFDTPYWLSPIERKMLEKEVFLTPANHYIQISYYKKHYENIENNSLYFRHNYGMYDFPFDYCGWESKICDERFFYIIDFMNLLAEKTFEKEDFCLELAEMQKLADEFAQICKHKPLNRTRSKN